MPSFSRELCFRICFSWSSNAEVGPEWEPNTSLTSWERSSGLVPKLDRLMTWLRAPRDIELLRVFRFTFVCCSRVGLVICDGVGFSEVSCFSSDGVSISGIANSDKLWFAKSFYAVLRDYSCFFCFVFRAETSCYGRKKSIVSKNYFSSLILRNFGSDLS